MYGIKDASVRLRPLLLVRRLSLQRSVVHVQQENGEAGVFRKRYRIGVDQVVADQVRDGNQRHEGFGKRELVLKKYFVDHLLPKHYETSVGPTYLQYALWHMGGSVVGTMSSVLSTQSLLYAIGLGAGSIPMAAALNWILKDGLGQLGGVLFASMINQKFDAEPKRWRFKSALILDASILLEVITPWFPSYFLPLASVANIGKNIGWLSASASRAGIHRSFMQAENLADITGKAGSQTIAASVIGTGLGLGISSIVGTSTGSIICATGVLSMIHLGCTFKSLDVVVIKSFNIQRFWLAIRPIFDDTKDGVKLFPERLLEPSRVASMERIFHFGEMSGKDSVLKREDGSFDSKLVLTVGANFQEAFQCEAEFTDSYERAMEYGDKHVVSVVHNGGKTVIHLIYFETAESRDLILGLLDAIVVHESVRKANEGTSMNDYETRQEILTKARADLASRVDLDHFITSMQKKGWDTSHTFFEPTRARFQVETTVA